MMQCLCLHLDQLILKVFPLHLQFFKQSKKINSLLLNKPLYRLENISFYATSPHALKEINSACVLRKSPLNFFVSLNHSGRKKQWLWAILNTRSPIYSSEVYTATHSIKIIYALIVQLTTLSPGRPGGCINPRGIFSRRVGLYCLF